MISDKLIQCWIDEGDLKTPKSRFLCEISLCANQQIKVDNKLSFSINDLIKIGKINYNQFANIEVTKGQKVNLKSGGEK